MYIRCPAGAAVDELVMQVGGHELRGKIKEKQAGA